MAAIIFEPGAEQHYCRLNVKELSVPDEFALLFWRGGPTHSGNYKVVWRRGQEIRAMLLEAA